MNLFSSASPLPYVKYPPYAVRQTDGVQRRVGQNSVTAIHVHDEGVHVLYHEAAGILIPWHRVQEVLTRPEGA